MQHFKHVFYNNFTISLLFTHYQKRNKKSAYFREKKK